MCVRFMCCSLVLWSLHACPVSLKFQVFIGLVEPNAGGTVMFGDDDLLEPPT